VLYPLAQLLYGGGHGPIFTREESELSTKLNTLALFFVPLLPLPQMLHSRDHFRQTLAAVAPALFPIGEAPSPRPRDIIEPNGTVARVLRRDGLATCMVSLSLDPSWGNEIGKSLP
jgi:hypothetical protein